MPKRYHLSISLWMIVFLLFPSLRLAIPSPAPSSAVNLLQPSSTILSHLTLEEKIGQMLILGFQGTQASTSLLTTIKEIGPGGFILYGSNISSPLQTAALTHQLQEDSAIPLFVSTDEEGGVVSRIAGGTTMPAALALGAARSPQLAYQAGQATGEELIAMGINVDFAPVLDVLHEPDRSSLGSRCFSSDPTLVSNLSLAFARGLSDAGIIAGVKHFPGHGLAPLDSHLDIPLVEASRQQLNTDLKPFQLAIASGAELVMTAHIAYPALDSTQVISHKNKLRIHLPASLSSDIISGLARREMGYKGVIITDSLLMRPILDHFGSQEEAAVMAIKAGSDLLLIQKDPLKVQQRLLRAVRSGDISENRINESVKRLLDLKLKRGLIAFSHNRVSPGIAVNRSQDQGKLLVQEKVGNSAHRSLQQEIANKAVTLLQNQKATLPLKLTEGQRIVCFVPLESMLPAAQASLAGIITTLGLKKATTSTYVFRTLDALSTEHLSALGTADHIIIFSYGNLQISPTAFNPQRNFPVAVAEQSKKLGKMPVIIAGEAIRDKTALSSFPGIMLTYGYNGASINAGLKTAFGLIKPAGRLPSPVQSADGELLFAPGYGLRYP